MSERPKKAKPLHQPTAEKKPSAWRRGYDKRHVNLRAQLLAERPICEVRAHGCTGFSTDAHHLRYGHDLTLDDYLAVCRNCHHKLKRDKNQGR